MLSETYINLGMCETRQLPYICTYISFFQLPFLFSLISTWITNIHLNFTAWEAVTETYPLLQKNRLNQTQLSPITNHVYSIYTVSIYKYSIVGRYIHGRYRDNIAADDEPSSFTRLLHMLVRNMDLIITAYEVLFLYIDINQAMDVRGHRIIYSYLKASWNVKTLTKSLVNFPNWTPFARRAYKIKILHARRNIYNKI